MDELISQFFTISRGMWKHRWLGLLAAWVVAIVGVFVVISVPDKYEASARVYVDTQSILKPLMAGLAVQPNVEQQIGMLSRTLISRPNVEKLVRMADLDLGIKSKAGQEALIDHLMTSLQIKNVGRDNLYVLAYRDANPDKAKRVIQSLVSIFVESSLGDSRKDSETAKKFIDEQIKTYETKLQDAEKRLKEFKLRNLELQTGDGKGVVDQISGISAQLNQARLELREAENARDSARKQLDQERASSARDLIQMSESLTSMATPEIDARIEVQKRNLDALLQRFTEQHPDVAGARRLIRELEDMKRKEIQALRKAALSNPVSSNSTSLANQELGRLLATAEVQVASLRARVGEYDARYQRAREMMKAAPEIDAEFAQLNRDYDINKKNYNDLVTRRESASLSGDLDSTTGVADFRLIDPPRASAKPVAPNRMLLLPIALLASLSAGLVVAFLMSQIRAVFQDGRSLSDTVGLPLLGVITLVEDDESIAAGKTNLRKFILAIGALFGVFAVGVGLLALLAARAG